MQFFNGNSSSLRPMKRPKEYYEANDTFIISLPSNLRRAGETEFHIGKDIFNRSDRYAEWGGNEALSRMQRKYCFSPTNCYGDINVMKKPQFSCGTMEPNISPSTNCGTPKESIAQRSQSIPFNTDMPPSWSLSTNGNNNKRNWSSSNLEPMNEWPSSRESPMKWPTKHYPLTSFGTRSSYGNNYHISNVQKPNGQHFKSENKFNSTKSGYYNRPQRGSEPFNEFLDSQASYSQQTIMSPSASY